ncbi:HD-GYP domain-containing protein [Pseudomonadota bacterium]
MSLQHITRCAAVHYVLAAILFSLYGGRVCHFLDTIPGWQAVMYSFATFAVIFTVRTALLKNHRGLSLLLKEIAIFVAGAVGLAAWYNVFYHFPIESNLKVLLGIGGLGLLVSLDLALQLQIANYPGKECEISFEGVGRLRYSIAMQMTVLVIFMVILLTTLLGMIVAIDMRWLVDNISMLHYEDALLNVIKEFAFVAVVFVSYAVAIMYHWLKLLRLVLDNQQHVLIEASKGNLTERVPVVQKDELGVIAYYTNQMLHRLEQSYEEVNKTRDVAIVGLSALAESRDNETGSHILRTQEYVRTLANQLRRHDKFSDYLDENTIELLYKSAPLHDIGKVGVPDAILLKPGKLTDEEFSIMKTHAQIGAESIAVAETQMDSNSFLSLAREIALTHHEKWDGSGYPNGLQGDQIPLSGRLMALADVYDALISKRVYKPAFSHEKAKAIILEGRDRHFDPAVVDAFLSCEQMFVSIAQTYQDETVLAA